MQLEQTRKHTLPKRYRVIDPTNGAVLASGEGHEPIEMTTGAPRVVIYVDI